MKAQVVFTNAPSLKQQIYDAIKRSIVHCEYAPNSQLNEDVFCRRFNASRTPVRDALSRLEQEGLVIIQPKRGVLISPVSLRAINEVFEVRMRIEPYAVYTYGNRLSEEVYADYWRRFSAPVEDAAALYALDARFHYAFIDAADNRYLAMFYRITADQTERYRILSSGAERLDLTQHEHAGIVSACIRRDWRQASELMRAHIDNSRDSIIDYALKANRGQCDAFEAEPASPTSSADPKYE